MPRPEKVQAVAEIKQAIEEAEAVFVTEFRGLSVKEIQDLRRGLRASGAEYKVVKMTLARLAAQELGLESMTEHLAGPTALAFARRDAAATAKVLADVGKDSEHLVIKAGLLSGEVLLPEQVGRLAQIEPRDVLLAKIAGAAQAPLAKMAGMLTSFTRDAASMFSQLLERKESASEPAAAPSETKPPEATPATEVEPEAAAAPAETAADIAVEATAVASTADAVSDESPADESPADESPADESPADESPADESQSDADEPAVTAEEE